ncbi:glycyl-radical enzyme activating protein [Thermodesulfobacteriota bacterium]
MRYRGDAPGLFKQERHAKPPWLAKAKRMHMDSRSINKNTGLIFNIQRYSLHDGPGIRTTVFMKGCPLRCAWCSNPESWHPFPEILARDARCVRCGKCEQVCPAGAITITPEERKIDREKCTLCLECASVCPAEAIIVTGRYITIDEAVKEVESDKIFYGHSGGGVTVSGGEALFQWEFVSLLLKTCKEKGINTVLDTSGYCSWDRLEKVLDYVDLVLFDIKHMDPDQHYKMTQTDNALIISNVKRIALKKKKIWLRAPLIPGYNDSPENIEKTARLGLEIGAEKISILPFHEWGLPKWDQLDRAYTFMRIESVDETHYQKIQKLYEDCGLKATIGR